MVIIGLFNFFYIMISGPVFGIGLLLYVGKWNLPIVWLINGYLVSFVASTLSTVYFGYLGDKYKSKFGRRKPFVAFAFVLRAIAFICLVLPPNKDSEITLVSWFIVFYSCFKIGNSANDNSFASWMIESSRDNNDYMKFKTIVSPISSFFGGIVALAIFFIISPVVCAFIAVIGGGIATYILIHFLPNVTIRAVNSPPPIVPSVRIACRTYEFKQIFVNRVIEGAAVGMYYSANNIILLVGFNNFEYIKDYITYTLINTIVGGVGNICFVIICNKLLVHVEKLKLYLLLTRIAALIGLFGFVVSIFRSDTTFVMFFVSYVVLAIVYGPLELILSLFVRDLVVYDTFTTNLSRENLYITAISTPSSVIVSFISALPIVFLYQTGFKQNENLDDDRVDENFEYNVSSLWVLRIFGPLMLFLLGIVAYWNLRNYPLTTKLVEDMNNIIHERVNVREDNTYEGNAAVDVKSPISSEQDDYMSSSNEKTSNQLHDEEVELARQMLLHLSIDELGAICVQSSDSSSPQDEAILGLQRISKLNFAAIACSFVVMLSLGFALVTDLLQSSVYSTLIVSIWLVTSFYLFYEVLRRQSIDYMLTAWSNEKLRDNAIQVYGEFSSYHETLKERIEKNGISDENSSDTVCVPLTVTIPTSTHLPGYKRIFFVLFLIFSASIAIGLGHILGSD